MNLEIEGAYACMWSVCTFPYLAAIDAGQWPVSSHGHFIVLLSGWVEMALSLVVIKNRQIFASPRIELHSFGPHFVA